MKAKDLKKVFEWMSKFQGESGIQIISLTIGVKWLKFKDANECCYQVKIEDVVNE